MFGTYVLFTLFITSATFEIALGQSDLTLTCPEKWNMKKPVTLYCEVAKSSITSKCEPSSPDTTFFNLDTGSGAAPLCVVGAAEYSTCNFGTPSSTSCGCRQNASHYTFVYYIKAVGKEHEGDWSCQKSCIPATGSSLTSFNSPFCTGVEALQGSIEHDCCIACAVVLLLLVAVCDVAIIVAVYCCLWKNFWRTIVLIVILVVAIVALFAGAVYCACKDLPHCVGLCVGITVTLIVMQIATVIAVICILMIRCSAFVIPPIPVAPIPTITSPREGTSTDSYTLTWTVPDTCCLRMSNFIVKYAQVEVDMSSGKWVVKQVILESEAIEVDGQARSVKLEGLSRNTFYEVSITVVTCICFKKTTTFTFKTGTSNSSQP